MERPTAIASTQIDDEHTRVTQWRFPPGGETGWHRHEWRYVVVPITSGQLTVETSEGASTNELTSGLSYTRPVPSEHNVVNPGETEFVFVEIELKPTQ